MSSTLLVIVTGPPASGKSSIARRIAGRFGLPNVNKDGIKETLFDSLGWRNRRQSARVNQATRSLLFHFADVLLAAGRPFVLESNFRPRRDEPAFRRLAERYPFRPLQVHCDAPAEYLVRRFYGRWQAGRRHPGHADNLTASDIMQDIRSGQFGVLDIGGTVYRLDTGDFESIDFAPLYEAVRVALAEDERPSGA